MSILQKLQSSVKFEFTELFSERKSSLGLTSNDQRIIYESKEGFNMQLKPFILDKNSILVCAGAGSGKSTAVIKCLKALNLPFVFLAPTKQVANQLGLDNDLPVVHADSTDGIAHQTISVYDHITKFIDFENLSKTGQTYLVIDEAHNIISSREYDFRQIAIRKLEEYQKYFLKTIYLTASPEDFRAYGNVKIIYVEETWKPLEVYATPYENELKTIAQMCYDRVAEDKKVMIYLQSTGKPLEELKKYLHDVGITDIQIFNSKDPNHYTESGMEKASLIDGWIKGKVLITTYAEGISLYNNDFDFICSANVDVGTAYQAFNRLRNTNGNLYYLFNPKKELNHFDEIYEPAFDKVLNEAKELKRKLSKYPSVNARYLEYRDKNPLLTLDGLEILMGEVSRRASAIAHNSVRWDWKALQTGFARYNVTLVKNPKILMQFELEYTPETRKQILEGIFYFWGSTEMKNLPSHYMVEIDKINELLKYLDFPEVKEFMLTDYVTKPSNYTVKLQQLQLYANPFDAQLKLNLEKTIIAGNEYKYSELNALVNPVLEKLNYVNPHRSIKALLEGLGFEVKPSTRHLGYEPVWNEKKQKMENKKITENILIVQF